MKRKIIFLGLLAFLCFMIPGAPPVFAQQAGGERRMEDRWGAGNISELYYVNVPIEKVYPYKLGYVVLFRKGANELGRAYIPYRWFRTAEKKAELFQLPDGKRWPSMSVFYKEGAFYAVKLYVAKRGSHLTWGNLPSTVNLDAQFEAAETIDLSFPDEQ